MRTPSENKQLRSSGETKVENCPHLPYGACGQCVRQRAVARGWGDKVHTGFTTAELAELGAASVLVSPVPQFEPTRTQRKVNERFADKIAEAEAKVDVALVAWTEAQRTMIEAHQALVGLRGDRQQYRLRSDGFYEPLPELLLERRRLEAEHADAVKAEAVACERLQLARADLGRIERQRDRALIDAETSQQE
ncbi:MAG TPA: hypothetical protein VFU43_25255 [Streptosporangiaceae bacterium]|nr:hypothetical protein [Streptosporangiaceae bacterium]